MDQTIISETHNRKKDFFRGLKTALPIVIGYLPIALSFGVISVQSEIPLLHTVLMSLIVYAGASQFMAANMLAIGALGIEIVFATFILNFRHFIMSMSLMTHIKSNSTINKALIPFGITDETFALISLEQQETTAPLSTYYVAGIMLASYSSWVIGTFVGGLLSMVIPPSISASMSIALYAMFIGLLVPAIGDNWRIGTIATTSGFLCYLFSGVFNSGWAIVFATLISAFIGSKLIAKEQG